MMVPLELVGELTVSGIVIERTDPAIAVLPAGAFLRRSTQEFSPVKALLDAVAIAARRESA